MRRFSLQSILELLAINGTVQYDREAVSQLDHALQCAALAESAGSSSSLITACLLHDIGHLAHHLPGCADRQDANHPDHPIGDRHQYRAMPLLQPLFDAAITEPIRLHVEAKRYLCATDPGYWARLSPASQQSLVQQGGCFSASAAAEFIAQPYAVEAVQLRQWDDRAKVVNLLTPDLAHFAAIAAECLRSEAIHRARIDL